MSGPAADFSPFFRWKYYSYNYSRHNKRNQWKILLFFVFFTYFSLLLSIFLFILHNFGNNHALPLANEKSFFKQQKDREQNALSVTLFSVFYLSQADTHLFACLPFYSAAQAVIHPFSLTHPASAFSSAPQPSHSSPVYTPSAEPASR